MVARTMDVADKEATNSNKQRAPRLARRAHGRHRRIGHRPLFSLCCPSLCCCCTLFAAGSLDSCSIMTSSLPPLNPLLQACGKRTRDIFASGLDDTYKDEEKRYAHICCPWREV